MQKPLIIIPNTCIPNASIMIGYSGGMALYVPNWNCVLLFFEETNVTFLAHISSTYSKSLN